MNIKYFLLFWVPLISLQSSFGQRKCDSTAFYSGVDFQDGQKFDKAIQEYTKQLKACPEFREAYINRAVCYFNLGSISKGNEDFRTAVQHSNDKPYTISSVAGFYFSAKQYDTAFIIYKSILSLDSNYSDAYFKMGRCKWLKRIQELQVSHNDDDYAKDPVFISYLKTEILNYYNKAIFIDSVKNYKRYKARPELEAAKDLNTHYDYYYYRGVVKQNFNDYTGALQDYETSLMIHSTINVRYYAALIARKVGENKKACEYIQQWAHTMSLSRDEEFNPIQKEEIANKFCKELGINPK